MRAGQKDRIRKREHDKARGTLCNLTNCANLSAWGHVSRPAAGGGMAEEGGDLAEDASRHQ